MSLRESPPRRRSRPLLVVLPLILFGALAAVFLTQLRSGHDPQALPSVLIGRQAPQTELPGLEGLAGADGAAIPGLAIEPGGNGRAMLVNVFASWCGPCRVEHPMLMELAADDRLDVVAINYKDRPEHAQAFLNDLGNPFAALGVDRTGSATIDWGVYGVPETFLVSPSGEILWKQTGPLTQESIRGGLLPALEGR